MAAPRKILVLTYWRFDDALIQHYTLPYVQIIAQKLPPGSTIHLVTLEREGENGQTAGVSDTIINYRLRLHLFGLKAMLAWAGNMFRLRRLIRKNNIDTIHCWCTPAGAIGYLLSRLTRKPLIIDSFEPHAEAMVENGTWKRSSLAFRILFYFEKKMARRASHLIACAPAMSAYTRVSYGIDRGAIPVKPACTDIESYDASKIKNETLLRELNLEARIVGVYAGKFGGIYYDLEAFRLFAAAWKHWGDRFRLLLLSAESAENIQRYCHESGLPMTCIVQRFVKPSEIPDYLGLADFACTPVKPVPTKKSCTPIKDGEYWASGLPVIIPPGISEDSDLIAANHCGVIWTDTSAEGCKKAIREMDLLLSENREALQLRCRQLAMTHRNFSIAEKIYAAIYEA